MNKLIKKLNNKEGFTLVEMLIVVAIIAILIAISIPLVNNALEKARHATDAANERSAKAVMLVESLDGGTITNAIYDAKDGKLKTTGVNNIVAYGKHSSHKVLQVSYKDGNVFMAWVAVPSTDAVPTALTADGTGAGSGLCSVTAISTAH